MKGLPGIRVRWGLAVAGSRRAVGAALLAAVVLPLSAAVDFEAAAAGPGLALDDPEARSWHHRLYDVENRASPDYLIARCHRVAGARALTVLVARLLHRKGYEEGRPSWHRELALRQAVVRHLRTLDEPGLLEAYRRVLADEHEAALIREICWHAIEIDRNRGIDLVVRVARPDEAIAASAEPASRRLALRILLDRVPISDRRLTGSLDWVFAEGGLPEVADALRQLEDEEALRRYSVRALRRFLGPLAEGREEVWQVVGVALRHLRHDDDPELARRCFAMAADGGRAFACALAGVVRRGRLDGEPPEGAVDAVIVRIGDLDPGPHRRALLQLISVWDPARLEALLPEDDPLRRFAGQGGGGE